MTVLAAIPVLLVVFAVAVMPMVVTATAATKIRQTPVGIRCVVLMSACRTPMSELRTIASDLRTTRISSSRDTAFWSHRSALTTSLLTSHESMASHDLDTRQAARAHARSPCSGLSEPGNRVHREPAIPVAPEPEASY